MAVDEKSLKPFGLGPQDGLYKPSDALNTDEGTVTMLFPSRVVLLTNDGKRVEFLPGIQEVPEHLADHDWLKRNGAQKYDSPLAKHSIANAKAVEDAQADFDKALSALNAAKAKAALSPTQAINASVEQMSIASAVPVDGAPAPAPAPADTDEDDDLSKVKRELAGKSTATSNKAVKAKSR